jgi:transposase
MKQKSGPGKAPAEQVRKDIRRQTRRRYSAEKKIRIVLKGLRGEENISELCRREGIAASMYYGWSKEFLEAGKRRLAGDTARAATSGEVKDRRHYFIRSRPNRRIRRQHRIDQQRFWHPLDRTQCDRARFQHGNCRQRHGRGNEAHCCPPATITCRPMATTDRLAAR